MQIKREEFDALNAQILGQSAQIEKLTKEKETLSSNRDYYHNQVAAFKNEIEQLHTLLDIMEGAGPREIEGEYGSKHTMPPMTRLAAWMAFKIKAQTSCGKDRRDYL